MVESSEKKISYQEAKSFMNMRKSVGSDIDP